MPRGPAKAGDYTPEQLETVNQTCLYIATRLGDLIDDLVVVGGLVPTLIVPQNDLPEGAEQHVGTMDVDVGMTVGLVDDGRYHTLAQRLREAGFKPDVRDGKIIRNRWTTGGSPKCMIDFLIEPRNADQKPGTLQSLEKDLAAVVTPGINLAFQDRRKVHLKGETIKKEKAARDMWVCGPGAFIVLKALATLKREKDKDPYDLYYVVLNFGSEIADAAQHLVPLLEDPNTQEALRILQDEFADAECTGPMRVAAFLGREGDEDLLADVVGVIRALLDALR